MSGGWFRVPGLRTTAGLELRRRVARRRSARSDSPRWSASRVAARRCGLCSLVVWVVVGDRGHLLGGRRRRAHDPPDNHCAPNKTGPDNRDADGPAYVISPSAPPTTVVSGIPNVNTSNPRARPTPWYRRSARYCLWLAHACRGLLCLLATSDGDRSSGWLALPLRKPSASSPWPAVKTFSTSSGIRPLARRGLPQRLRGALRAVLASAPPTDRKENIRGSALPRPSPDSQVGERFKP